MSISRLALIAAGLILLSELPVEAAQSTALFDYPSAALPTSQAADGVWHGLADWLRASFERTPALVFGLAALLLVPVLALIGLFLRSKEQPEDADDVTYLKTRVMKADELDSSEDGQSLTERIKAPARPSEAWVVVDGEGGEAKHGIGRALVRIGRESDNDIRLEDKTVHRYHAAIRRTEDAEFVITDLSSVDGNGVTLNGRPVAEARLADGDSIELGHAKLRFVARPA